jgi:ketosteroid isomerase-like protein
VNRLQPAASTPNEKILREQRARGKLSGVEISQRLFSVYRFRDSKVVELRVYADRAPALDSMHG